MYSIWNKGCIIARNIIKLSLYTDRLVEEINPIQNHPHPHPQAVSAHSTLRSWIALIAQVATLFKIMAGGSENRVGGQEKRE